MKICENDIESTQVICNQDEIMESVNQVAQFFTADHLSKERRFAPRQPFPKLVELIPYENDLENLLDPIWVVGKHLSNHGFDFFHTEAITHKHVLVTFPTAEDESVQFAIKVDWCRFLETGWYESGGRFIKLIKCHQGPLNS